MICTFMGTVIGIERAVAVKVRLAFVAPGASAAAGFAMLAGLPSLAGWLAVVAATAFIAVNVVVVERQRASHTVLLLTGAAARLVGNLLRRSAASRQRSSLVVLFLVFTIAAERLEMTRLMRRRRGAAALLYVCLGAMLLGSAAFALSPVWGGVVYGVSLVGLAGWMVRSTSRVARSQPAVEPLHGHLPVARLRLARRAGAAWVATSGTPSGCGPYALGLGFIFSMMLGRARLSCHPWLA